jgi:micrococcal nuclease
VVGISDGDTISVMHNGRAEKIRLNGIDCPEKRQAFGQLAKQFTVTSSN